MIKKINNIYQGKKENIEFYFSTKNGGISTGDYESLNLSFTVGDLHENVIENRKLFASMIDKDLDNFIYMNQTHSKNKYLVSKKDCGVGVYDISPLDETDCLYTFEKDLVLCAFFADCTPIYFWNKKHNLIGIVHAGWQGTVKEITYHVLSEIIEEYELDAKDFEIVMGPSIFNMEAKEDIFSLVPSEYFTQCCTQTTFDVRLCNTLQLHKLGIDKITYMDLDTYTNEEFFSFRRKNISGRMNGCITQS